MRYRRLGFIVTMLTVAAAGRALAQAAPQPEYHPSLADLMTSAVQPRHTKIGIASKARNWSYLTYEAAELRNAFNRISRTVPIYSNQSLDALIGSGIRMPIEELEAAAKAQDGRRFDKAYGAVTAACNTCHEALNKGWIVIRAPAGQAYLDQTFSVAGKP